MFVKKQDTKVFERPTCVVYEYGGTANLNLAVAEIKERYPERGWARNKEVDETYFILEGRGKVIVEKEEFEVEKDDLVLIEKGKWYRFEGSARVAIACGPTWTPEQYEEKDEL